jgi:hypothetical protein
VGRSTGREPDRVEVPQLVGMLVREARQAGHQAGVVVVSADLDGPPLGALTWPGVWIVTAQRPAPRTWVARWQNVVIEFEEQGQAASGGRSS